MLFYDSPNLRILWACANSVYQASPWGWEGGGRGKGSGDEANLGYTHIQAVALIFTSVASDLTILRIKLECQIGRQQCVTVQLKMTSEVFTIIIAYGCMLADSEF